jgi:hypothetical protein
MKAVEHSKQWNQDPILLTDVVLSQAEAVCETLTAEADLMSIQTFEALYQSRLCK